MDLSRKQATLLIGPPSRNCRLSLTRCCRAPSETDYIRSLEKRKNIDLNQLAEKLNSPGVGGYRFLSILNEVSIEFEALKPLIGADAELVATGGVCGDEGSC